MSINKIHMYGVATLFSYNKSNCDLIILIRKWCVNSFLMVLACETAGAKNRLSGSLSMNKIHMYGVLQYFDGIKR